MRLIATLSAALLASTALAQQAGVETPTDAQIQGSTVIKDTLEIPSIDPGEQAVEIEGAAPTGDLPRTAGQSVPEGGDAEATEKVEEIVEDAEVDPETGQVEASTGGAEPAENWFGCGPDQEAQDEQCEDNGEPVKAELPSEDGVGDTTAVEGGGEGSSVRPPAEGNEAVDNLTTGGTVAPSANEPANMSTQTVEETQDPDRPQELENEPQEVLTEEGGKIDLEEDARVVPETSTAAPLGSGG